MKVDYSKRSIYAISYGPLGTPLCALVSLWFFKDMKRATGIEHMLPMRDATIPAYLWLYDALRSGILEGRLRPGSRLPGTRDLGAQYGLSRGTIVRAFEQLKSEGYVEGKVGSGTYVSRILPEHWQQALPGAGMQSKDLKKQRRQLSDYGKRLNEFPGYEMRPTRAFRANVPALDLFPIGLWAQIAARRLRNASTYQLMGCPAFGYRPLREAIADYLITSRGVKCVSDQIAVVSGTQEAIDLVSRILLNSGDRVCMEDPGYIGATFVFKGAGARIAYTPLDEEGMKIPRGPAAKLAYVTPGHQFPLGITMSLSRRLKLLEWAHKSGALILEDDYDGEYRYSGRPLPSLQGLDRAGQVIYSGTFSKVLFPSLRLGYMVVPEDFISSFEAAMSITIRHMSLPEQIVLCDFMTEGHFGRHLRRMREVYAERLSALLEAASERLTGLLHISGVQAGLQTVGWLNGRKDATRAAKAAATRNVEVTPLALVCGGNAPRHGLILGFAAADPREIRRGARDLAAALETL